MRLDRCSECGHYREHHEHHEPRSCQKPECECTRFRRAALRVTTNERPIRIRRLPGVYNGHDN